jgi:hypothetical protein
MLEGSHGLMEPFGGILKTGGEPVVYAGAGGDQ